MTADTYRSALETAIQEYERLGDERRAIDRRLSELAQTIGTLTRLLGLTPTVPLGLTDACRLALQHGQPLTPTEVRDRLFAIGVDLSVYANPLAAIHTVLKRLHQAGELRHGPSTTAGRSYLWQGGRTGTFAIRDDTADVIRRRSPSPAHPSMKRRSRR